MPAKAKPQPRWRCQCGELNRRAALKCSGCGLARPWKRGGLHRLECCDCPTYGYFTVAALEAAGQLPVCFARGCNGDLVPDELELALLLGVESPAVAEYQAECQSIAHGQASHGIRGRVLQSVEAKAAARVSDNRRARARSNRLQALRPAAEVIPF